MKLELQGARKSTLFSQLTGIVDCWLTGRAEFWERGNSVPPNGDKMHQARCLNAEGRLTCTGFLTSI